VALIARADNDDLPLVEILIFHDTHHRKKIPIIIGGNLAGL
jgi:hypothetical protein